MASRRVVFATFENNAPLGRTCDVFRGIHSILLICTYITWIHSMSVSFKIHRRRLARRWMSRSKHCSLENVAMHFTRYLFIKVYKSGASSTSSAYISERLINMSANILLITRYQKFSKIIMTICIKIKTKVSAATEIQFLQLDFLFNIFYKNVTFLHKIYITKLAYYITLITKEL